MGRATTACEPARPQEQYRSVLLLTALLLHSLIPVALSASPAPTFAPTQPSALPTVTSLPTTPAPSPSPTDSPAQYYCFGGRRSCPDEGLQSATLSPEGHFGSWSRHGSGSGGVVVRVHRAVHLPDEDTLGDSGGPDPYVQVNVYRRQSEGGYGKVSSMSTRTISSAFNPTFEEELFVGVHEAATRMSITAWDADSGLETIRKPPFGDDLLGSQTIQVPFCSAFLSDVEEIENCDTSLELCRNPISSWESPQRKMCNTSMWLRLKGSESPHVDDHISEDVVTDNDFSHRTVDFVYPSDWVPRKRDCPRGCLEVTVAVNPFEVMIWSTDDYNGPPQGRPVAVEESLGVSVANEPGLESWNYDWGSINMNGPQPNVNQPLIAWEKRYLGDIMGGLMVQTQYEDREVRDTYRYARIAINYDAYVWVCRYDDDDGNDADDAGKCTESKRKQGLCKVPRWLRKSDGWTVDQWYACSADTGESYSCGASNVKFRCYRKFFKATKMNRYGYPTSRKEPIELGGNAVGARGNVFNYFVVAVPALEGSRPAEVAFTMDLSVEELVVRFFENILLLVIFIAAVRFLRVSGFRLDRIELYLTNLEVVGAKRHVSGFLFHNLYNAEGDNSQWRQNVFYASLAVRFSLLAPLCFLWMWALNTIATVNPPGLGFFFLFVGTGFISLWFGWNRWAQDGWRMSPPVLRCLGVMFVSVVVFCVFVVFVDPAVYIGNQELSFGGLGVVFFTLNAMALIPYYFARDEKANTAMKHFMVSLNTASKQLKRARPPAEDDAGELGGAAAGQESKSSIHYLLKGVYSLTHSIPSFKYSKAVLFYDPNNHKAFQNRMYRISLATLFIYWLIASAATSKGGLAFLNVVSVVFFDYMQESLIRSSGQGSSGYHVCLMATGRLSVACGGSYYWVIGYGAAYVAYGGALVESLIDKYLPFITQAQAGSTVFLGGYPEKSSKPDIAASPSYLLAVLSFCFLFILLVASYTEPDDMPMPAIPIGDGACPMYVIGVMGFLAVIGIGSLVAALRAAYLMKQMLLRSPLDTIYLYYPGFKLPLILAALTYFVLVVSGLFVYGATSSPLLFVSSIFVPPIIALVFNVYTAWKVNDFELVPWPPRPTIRSSGGDDTDISEEDYSASMLESIIPASDGEGFGAGDGDVGTASRKGDLAVTDFNDDDQEDGSPKTGLQRIALPPLVKTGPEVKIDIKMPLLPPKRALQKTKEKAASGAGGGSAPRKANSDLDDEGMGDGEVELLAEFGVNLTEESALLGGKPDTSRQAAPAEDAAQVVQRRKRFAIDASGGPKAMAARFKKWTRDQFRKKKDTAKYYISKYITKQQGQITDYEVVEMLKEGEDGEDMRDGAASAGAAAQERGLEAVPEPDFKDMPFYQAILEGWLTDHEYRVLAQWSGLLLLIFVFGEVLAAVMEEEYVGHIVWTSVYTAMFTFLPIFQYFQRYERTPVMYFELIFAGVLHLITMAVLFAEGFDSDANDVASLWILDAFLLYYLGVVGVVQFLLWWDSGWVIQDIDADGDGKLSLVEILQTVNTQPVIIGAGGLICFQMFIWGDGYFATTATLLYGLVLVFVLVLLRNWAQNDFYLEEKYQRYGKISIRVCMFLFFIVGLTSNVSTYYCVSGFFWLFMFEKALELAHRYMDLSARDTVIFFSPYVFPVFSFSSDRSDLEVENDSAVSLYLFLGGGTCWGISMAVLEQPVEFGVAITCAFLLLTAVVTSVFVQMVPLQLGNAARFVTTQMILEAASMARDVGKTRRAEFKIVNQEWDETDEAANDMWENELGNAAFGTFMESPAAQPNSENTTAARLARHLAAHKTAMRYRDNPDGVRSVRQDGLSTLEEAFASACIAGRGPFGFVTMSGNFFRVYMGLFDIIQRRYLKDWPRERWCPLLARYDEKTGLPMQVTEHGGDDIQIQIDMVPTLQENLAKSFFEEYRAFVHFQLLVVSAATSNLEREKTIFQKFLRENRFKLLSNGIAPPPDIFNSSSFASIDIKLVAVWMSSLSRDEIDRFHLLKKKFSSEIEQRDRAVDVYDERSKSSATTLLDRRKAREIQMSERQKTALREMYERRLEKWMRTLTSEERTRFESVRRLWETKSCSRVADEDINLKKSFDEKVAYMNEGESFEGIGAARDMLSDIESGDIGCRVSRHRRMQFFDASFPADRQSLGQAEKAREVVRWASSIAINPDAQLFDDGTDPDDVFPGQIETDWIMSALSMLAAAGGVGDSEVDRQVRELFISQIGADGMPTYGTDVGAYGVRLYANGQWQSVILDDQFPMLTDESAREVPENTLGAACAYSPGFRELWVPLVEKAFAKFYGGYGNIEEGFVHHALHTLTGAETHCVFLAKASRGAGKRSLWGDLLRHRKNGYILGAGTLPAHLADKQIQQMGLQFASTYTIYDVRKMGKLKLVKLRNPPGDHEEWKGDWSDASPLWTRRLKTKLGVEEVDDNTFWMAFDDFVNAFRILYVCKWCDPDRWTTVKFSSAWRMANDLQHETAAGLPSKHNPGCELHNNPQWALYIHRPIDLKIRIKQADQFGSVPREFQPASAFLVRSGQKNSAPRVKELSHDNIVAWTGQPVRESEYHLEAPNLSPGVYILLVGTYTMGLEGPVSVEFTTNFKARIEQVWPPLWAPGQEPTSAVEKFALKAAAKAGNVASKAAGAAKEAAKKTAEKAKQKLEDLQDDV